MAKFHAPVGIARSYVLDRGNNSIRAIGTASGGGVYVSTLVGKRTPGDDDGWPSALDIGRPTAILCEDNKLYINGNGMQVIDVAGDSGAVRVIATVQGSISGNVGDWFGKTPNALYIPRSYTITRIESANRGHDRRHHGCRRAHLRIDHRRGAAGLHHVHQRRPELPGQRVRRGPRGPVESPVSKRRARQAGERIGGMVTDGTYVYGFLGGSPSTSPGIGKVDISQTPTVLVNRTVIPTGYSGLAVQGNTAYYSANNVIWQAPLGTTNQQTAFLTAPAVAAPSGLCISGSNLFVTDQDTGSDGRVKGVIRKVNLTTSAVATLTLTRATQ